MGKAFEKWLEEHGWDRDVQEFPYRAALKWVDNMFTENMLYDFPIHNVKKEIKEELGKELEDK